MVSVIQKLSPHFSLAKWLLCSTGLIRYLHPTDNELKTLAGVCMNAASLRATIIIPIISGVPKSKGKRHTDHHKADEKSNTFHVPRNLDLSLETTPVSPLDLVHLRYYTEYQWLVDFSLYTGIVYTMSEVRRIAGTGSVN